MRHRKPPINWQNPEERIVFENHLWSYRDDQKKRGVYEKIRWFISIFIIQFAIVCALYGPCAYYTVSLATDEKKEEENILFQKCKNESNLVETASACQFKYYELQNYILINVYPYLTVICQGTAFICVCLWHVTDYKWWNFLATITACFCLPVDMLIFYVEPLGFAGTNIAMVLATIPFCIVMADAAFPTTKEEVMANNHITTVNRNSWTEDFSLTYNQRYNFVARITWKAWMAFSTVALGIELLKGVTYNEVALGIAVMLLEGIPQMLSLALGLIHWDSSFDEYGFGLFEALVDIPLVLWYMSFYCTPRTKNAVIGKLLVNYISIAIGRYEDYADKYIYVECDVTKTERSELQNIKIKYLKRCGLTYDVSKVINVSAHQIFIIIACPFVGLWESFKAINRAFIRDLNRS